MDVTSIVLPASSRAGKTWCNGRQPQTGSGSNSALREVRCLARPDQQSQHRFEPVPRPSGGASAARKQIKQTIKDEA